MAYMPNRMMLPPTTPTSVICCVGFLLPQFGQVFASVLISFLHSLQAFNAMLRTPSSSPLGMRIGQPLVPGGVAKCRRCMRSA